jgi:hypothetical protein
MIRFFAVFLALAAAVYGNGNGACNCAPNIVVLVNGNNYSSDFTITSDLPDQTYAISGSITNQSPNSENVQDPEQFALSLNVNTSSDPEVDFGLDASSGDPTVDIFITQDYLGSFPILNTDTSGLIFDHAGGLATVTGNPTYIQTTSIDFVPVNQVNIGCTVTSTPVGGTPCPPDTQASQAVGGQGPNINILELDIQFTLTPGDEYRLNGSSTLSSAPEPATVLPLTAIFLAMGGFGWWRNRNRGSLA